MKRFFFIAFASMVANLAIAQIQETVTINVTGNRNKQVTVDGRTYTISNVSVSGEQDVVISDLTNGQHTLQVIRLNPNTNRTTTTSTTFNLREGYDLDISVNANGAVSMTERKSGRNNGGNAISNAAFTKLYNATKSRTSSTSRASYLENEFVNTNKRFTSKQASQLIALVNSESLRLALAKNAYTRVVDEENYAVVRSLLNSTANRNNLDNYIATLPDEDDDNDGNASTPISNQKFQAIYNEVRLENSNTDRNYYLSNFFGKDYNFYTSAQARQLIQLVTTEQERFYLAKVAYRGIIDRSNYEQVVTLLNSNSNRADLRTYIASYDQNNNNNNNTGVAMSSTAFNSLYQSVSYQSNTTTRYNSINNAFNTYGNFFTTTQARQLIQLVSNEGSRLALAKTSYRTLVDKANYTLLNDLFTSLTYRKEWADYVYQYNNNSGVGTGVAMSETEYKSLYNNVSGSWSASTRYSLVSNAFQSATNYFTTTQARQLLLLINNETERLALAKMVYGHLVDQQNYAVMSDLFANSVNRNEWARFANETVGGGYVKTPMTESEFSSIYRNVQFTFGFGAKMSSLTEIFNKETNYFTVQQTKRLIELVSAENNRLELAKLAYGNLTDPENYTELYTVFSSQSSKDEFNAYVGSNAYLNK